MIRSICALLGLVFATFGFLLVFGGCAAKAPTPTGVAGEVACEQFTVPGAICTCCPGATKGDEVAVCYAPGTWPGQLRKDCTSIRAYFEAQEVGE